MSDKKIFAMLIVLAVMAALGAVIGLCSPRALPGEPAIFAAVAVAAVIAMAAATARYVRLQRVPARPSSHKGWS